MSVGRQNVSDGQNRTTVPLDLTRGEVSALLDAVRRAYGIHNPAFAFKTTDPVDGAEFKLQVALGRFEGDRT